MTLLNKLCVLKDKIMNHGGEHEIMAFQAMKGRFYVLYSDGKKSQNMSYRTAKDYAEIFKGFKQTLKFI